MTKCLCGGSGTWQVMDSRFYCDCQVGLALKAADREKEEEYARTSLVRMRDEIRRLEDRLGVQ